MRINVARPRGLGRWGLCLIGICYGCESSVETLDFEVVRTLPHDSAAYTQGLVHSGNHFFESTGRYGESEVRRVEVATGEVVQSTSISDDHFGEGLALVDDRLIQLTWKAGLAFVYDVTTLEPVDTLTYEGEGWGICYDGTHLYMTDGTNRLYRRDPATFDVLDELRVRRDGFSVQNLNELECVGNDVYANQYLTDKIVRIDKNTGTVVSELDAYSLTLSSERPPDAGAVLNGIAYDATSGNWFLTGKLWPKVFEVRFAN
ncbi:MAG: glutaminyl-peptide cyclotransferase [Longimicrobiales bacterium]